MCVCDCALEKRGAYLIFMRFVGFYGAGHCFFFCSLHLMYTFSFACFQEQYSGDMQCIIHAFRVGGGCDALGVLPMRFYAQCDR